MLRRLQVRFVLLLSFDLPLNQPSLVLLSYAPSGIRVLLLKVRKIEADGPNNFSQKPVEGFAPEN